MTWSNRDEDFERLKQREFTFSVTFSLPSPSSDLKVPNVMQGNPAHGKWLCLSLSVTIFWNRMGTGIKEVQF